MYGGVCTFCIIVPICHTASRLMSPTHVGDSAAMVSAYENVLFVVLTFVPLLLGVLLCSMTRT